MIYGRSRGARRPRLRRARRGALPPGRVPRSGVGGGDHPPARRVRLVCLSATVSNAAELADVDRDRARPDARRWSRSGARSRLDNHYLVGDRTTSACTCCRRSSTGDPNPEAARLDAEARVAVPTGATGAGPAGERPAGSSRRAASRSIELLAERGHAAGDLLHLQPEPVRRRGTQRRRRGRTADQRRRARGDPRDRRGAASAASTTPTSPCSATAEFLAQLEAGVAAHHAGMVPPFKEAVEACFVAGLVKVVFATETLAVGINMPARTVVIEKLTKFTGERPRAPHAGRVHPAHGAGRAAGHRRRRARRRAVVAVRAVRPGRGARRRAARSICARRSARRTTWRPTSCGAYAGRAGAPPAEPVVRAVPGRPRRRAPRGAARAARDERWPTLAQAPRACGDI